MERAAREIIEEFLARARELIRRGRTDLVPRSKTLSSLAKTGLTLEDVWEEISALEPEDYYRGPKQDFDRPGEIWEFKKDLEGIWFYVKMKIESTLRGEVLKCLGFHEDDYPGARPFCREEGVSLETGSCPLCGREILPRVLSLREVYEVRGEKVEVEAETLLCPECGEGLYSPELDSGTLKRAYALYRERHHLMTPGELTLLRELLGLREEELLLLTGISARALVRFLCGSLLPEGQEERLLLLRTPEGISSLTRENRGTLGEELVQRILRRLPSLFAADRGERERAFLERNSRAEPSLENGLAPFSYDKFSAMVLYFLERGGGLLKVKLVKLLGYADMLFFKEQGKSISGCRYLHFAYGPVPAGYELLFAMMEEQGLLSVEEREGAGGYRGVLLRPRAQESGLSSGEREVLARVYERFLSFGSAEISAYSHLEEGYRNTRTGEVISYAYAKNLRFF